MRSAQWLVGLTSIVAALGVGCGSSSGGGDPPSTGSSSSVTPGDPSSGDPAEEPPAPVKLAVTGQGSIWNDDDELCSSNGSTTTGTCSVPYAATVYPAPASGWWFDHWEPLGSTTGGLAITLGTPRTVTAVFVPAGQVRDAGPPGTSPAR